MQSATVQNEQFSKDTSTFVNPPSSAANKSGLDWRDMGWFLERQNDDLAGYLFAEDCEVRRSFD